jgi:hypothetical protein
MLRSWSRSRSRKEVKKTEKSEIVFESLQAYLQLFFVNKINR